MKTTEKNEVETTEKKEVKTIGKKEFKKAEKKVKKEKKNTKKVGTSLSWGAVIILVLAAISFIFIPGMGQAGNSSPVFGGWGSENVKWEQDSYFLRLVQDQVARLQSNGQTMNDQMYMYVLYNAFQQNIEKLAFIDYVESAGYTVSEKKISKAMLPYFLDRDGKYSKEAFNKTANTDKIKIRNDIEEELAYSRYVFDYFPAEVFSTGNDVSFGLKVSDSELAFINKMNDTAKTFDIVFFDTNEYPEDEAVKFAKENADLFNKYTLDAISVDSASAAKKILAQINNQEITFQDAVDEYSAHYYTTADGRLKNQYEYQIKGTIPNATDFDSLKTLAADQLSGVIQTGTGYTIFKCAAPVEAADFTNDTVVTEVLNYMKSYEMGRVEEYFTAQANSFVADAKASGFDKACRKYNLTKQTADEYVLNYNYTDLIRSPEVEIDKLYSVYGNKEFLKSVFNLPTNEISEPIVLGTDIAVVKVVNSKSSADPIEKTAYIEKEAAVDQAVIKTSIFDDKKFKNNFDKAYTKYFAPKNN